MTYGHGLHRSSIYRVMQKLNLLPLSVEKGACQIFYKAVQQHVYSLTESVLKTSLQIYCQASQRKNFHNQSVFGEVTPKNTVFHTQQQTDHLPTCALHTQVRRILNRSF